MTKLKNYLLQYPLLLAIIFHLILATLPMSLLNYFENESPYITILVKGCISTLVIWFLLSANWGARSGVTNSFSVWSSKWWLMMLPFIVLPLLNLLSVEWDRLIFSLEKLFSLLGYSFTVGTYEEVISRALIFYILIRGWGHTRMGLLSACLVQALIFGVAHYMNLLGDGDPSHIHVQVISATLMGIGFGGLYLGTKSIWPGVMIHFMIDGFALINVVFGELKNMPGVSLGEAIPQFIVLFIVSVIPGVIYTMKASLFSRNDEQGIRRTTNCR